VNLADVPVAILAGGRATRLGALAADTPKALIRVAGRPFVDHQLDLLRRRGLRRVVLCVGHLGNQIADHVGDGRHYGLDVHYAFDGPRLLGTGGAIRRAVDALEPLCWVLYGDSYLDFDYSAALARFDEHDEPAQMTVYRNRGRWDQSNVAVRDGRVICYDKRRPRPEMEYIDYGASLLRSAAIDRIPWNEPSDLGDLFYGLSLEGLLASHEVVERFYEVGSRDGIADLERYLEISQAARSRRRSGTGGRTSHAER
jgi:NDP-sugar pyrophosphorylase family protein